MSQRTTAKNKHKGTKIFSLSLYFFFGFVFWLWVINFTKSSDSSTGNSAIKSSSASSQISISPTQLQSEGIVQTQHQSSNLSDLSAPSLHPSIPFFRNPVLNLLSHPLHQSSFQQLSIDETLYRLHQTKECQHLPIFITMAKIASPIYAQLVENFQYTMERYNLLRCSLLICLNDLNCLNFCQEFSFPCYNYNESNEDFSTFEQIAKLKLFDIPKAVVPLFIVDIDVGFRLDPRLLLGSFMNNDTIDVLMQKDVTFIMNRTIAGWKTWYTRALPNLGLFLCKGNQRVSDVFFKAWKMYQSHRRRRDQPGTDQAIMQSALGRRGNNQFICWDFFPDEQAVLLDKIFKFESTAIELGGRVAANILTYRPLTNEKRSVVAAHATCYELRTKVDALKSVAAFWNPLYYLPNRSTLTMGLYYLNSNQLLNDVRGLVWLAASTNRSLLIPNIPYVGRTSASSVNFLNATPAGSIMWPGFRVAYRFPSFPVEVVEPGYYWRIEKDYSLSVPQPRVLSTPFTSFSSILALLLKHQNEPRLILNIVPTSLPTQSLSTLESRLSRWAITSGEEELKYGYPTGGIFEKDTKSLARIRLCHHIFQKPRGNRSCFDKCK